MERADTLLGAANYQPDGHTRRAVAKFKAELEAVIQQCSKY